MFGIDSAELLIIAVVALVVIGPKDLPRVMRTVGGFVARARGMAGQFRMGLDNMVRETELADMERKWREQNERIMQQHPAVPESDWGSAPAAQEEAGNTAPVADMPEASPPPRSVSPRIPARSGPLPPASGRRAPLPPRPRELP